MSDLSALPPLRGTLLDQFLIRVQGCDPVSDSPAPATAGKPFLSIITRTQGKRMAALREVFLCLAAQTSDDFEVVIIGHRMTPEARRAVETAIEEMPAFLRPRLTLIPLDHGNRTAPLNFALEHATGQYAVILDDDDLVLAHWVETFKALAATEPSKILRAVAVTQDFAEVKPEHGSPATRAIAAPDKLYPSHFDFLSHFLTNTTPPMVFAFPVRLFRDFGLRFDETLTTTEDWDFLMRAAMVCGVASSPEITAIYRRWPTGETSQTLHDKEEWQHNYNRICAKLDAMPLVLPPGSAAEIRECMTYRPPLAALQRQVKATYASTSWQVSVPLRLLRSGFKSRYDLPTHWESLTGAHLQQLLNAMHRSTSWRVTWPLRRVKRLVGNK